MPNLDSGDYLSIKAPRQILWIMEKKIRVAIVAATVFVAVIGAVSFGAILVNAIMSADLYTKLALSGAGAASGTASAVIAAKRE